MKLCTVCLQELFDADIKCYNCNSVSLINKTQIEYIKNKLIKTNNFQRKKLIKDEKYACVYNYLTKKMVNGIGKM